MLFVARREVYFTVCYYLTGAVGRYKCTYVCRVRQFQGDIIAGIAVGLTVVPQSLAYAKIAELPPQVCVTLALTQVYVTLAVFQISLRTLLLLLFAALSHLLPLQVAFFHDYLKLAGCLHRSQKVMEFSKTSFHA